MVLIRTPPDQTIFVKPHVQALANALSEEFGLTNFGTYLGHSPPEGPTQAIDIFTSDSFVGYALQDAISSWLRANTKKFSCRYHIRRHQIWNIERADEGYRDQAITGNRTVDHMDHVHETQYAYADVPLEKTPQGGDMLVFNVKDTGIFLQRGDVITHLLHPDHVMEFVRAGVPYQDKVEMSKVVAEQYLGVKYNQGGTSVDGRFTDLSEGTSLEFPYDKMLMRVRQGIDDLKQEYYDMMLGST